MHINRTIIRASVLVLYILIIGFVLLGISSVFSYLNTGADRAKMLHNEIEKVDYYLPDLVWTSLENEGRPMDNQTLKSIEGDYLDAWYIRQVALKMNNPEGIDDYYTQHARENIKAYINYNAENQVNIESTTLSHHVEVDFFSADGKVIVLTDKDVIEYKRIYKAKALVDEIKEQSTYHIIMLLEDGFWRIRHLRKDSSKVIMYPEGSNLLKQQTINEVKGINYYPQNCPWNMYGDCFNAEDLSRDLKIIESAGLNTVRLFIPYAGFGKAHVAEDKLEKIQVVLDSLDNHNLKAIITLFDFYGNYEVLDWTLNQLHIKTIVNRLKNHKAILAWDIKNEPDLDFESRGEEKVLAWLREMTIYTKSLDPKHAVTIGWSSPESGLWLKNYVDFVSFHYYKSPEQFEKSYKTLKQGVGEMPILLQEFGRSSYKGFWNPFGYSEADQAEYYREMQGFFKTNNVQFMSWTLYDFEHIPVSVVGRLPWRKHMQKKYGFIDDKGRRKPSFKFISKH